MKNYTSEGHHYSYETLNASSGDLCGWVDLLLLLCCASEDFTLQVIKAQGTTVLKQNKKGLTDKDTVIHLISYAAPLGKCTINIYIKSHISFLL